MGARTTEPIEIDLTAKITGDARRGLGKEAGKAGMATVAQMERHLNGIVRDELDRLEGNTPDDGEDERD